jgi:hypothetical protein
MYTTWPDHQAQRLSVPVLVAWASEPANHKKWAPVNVCNATTDRLTWEEMDIGYRWMLYKRQPALNLWNSLAASKAHRIMQACWLATVMACWSITCSPLRATTFSDSMTSVPSICHFTSSIAWASSPWSLLNMLPQWTCQPIAIALLSDGHSSDAVPFDCLHFGRKQECRCPHRASLPSSTIPNVFKLIVSQTIQTDSLHCIQHTPFPLENCT